MIDINAIIRSPDVDDVARCHFQVRFHGQKRDRIDQRREGRVVGVGPDFPRHVLAVALQLPDRERARELRLPALPMEQVAADLRLIHRLRGGESPELVQEIKKRQSHDTNTMQGAPHPDAAPPDSSTVDRPLDGVSATRHGGKMTKSELRNPKKESS